MGMYLVCTLPNAAEKSLALAMGMQWLATAMIVHGLNVARLLVLHAPKVALVITV
jgi:hypothetical protein